MWPSSPSTRRIASAKLAAPAVTRPTCQRRARAISQRGQAASRRRSAGASSRVAAWRMSSCCSARSMVARAPWWSPVPECRKACRESSCRNDLLIPATFATACAARRSRPPRDDCLPPSPALCGGTPLPRPSWASGDCGAPGEKTWRSGAVATRPQLFQLSRQCGSTYAGISPATNASSAASTPESPEAAIARATRRSRTERHPTVARPDPAVAAAVAGASILRATDVRGGMSLRSTSSQRVSTSSLVAPQPSSPSRITLASNARLCGVLMVCRAPECAAIRRRAAASCHPRSR